MQQAELFALLAEMGIQYVKVDHPAYGSVEDYHRDGITFPGQCVKNLFLKNRKGNRFYLLVLDELKTADLAALASQVDEARLSFASEDRLQELMQLTAGSVTPFGLANDVEHRITLLLDSDIDPDQLIGFHPMSNDSTICLSVPDFLRFLRHTGHEPVQVQV
ncbi:MULTISPECIES: prolyl-tRNA synthetase associated domain-containing protein [unclassified Paludibacterium]|uniref:prolyl-tRNA synthetase associated domain-containing protein n=1 Tax=unclassified Paludibacterium TaxID=2618429 RepID=UPI001C04EF0C|nr:prolyl-tRNA synthetase associated domain-containing protein [Paludibacterium sp. B53371]BEV71443.1 YbaK/EbsC family protein [Paludibacterium sp. THUN1379]